MTESFTYDRFNRLDSIKFNSLASVMTYDPHGRILSKQADGHTVFENAQYAYYDQNSLLKPHAISSATVPNNSVLTSRFEADYTTFDKVKSLTKYDANNYAERTLAYTYGYDHQRVRMVDSVGNSLYRKKTYVGNCEYNHDPDCERTLTYLSAPSGVFAVHLQEGGYYLDNVTQVSQRLLYLHKDHLGSITTITDASGTILQELSFDAWGNLRNPSTWSGSFTGTPLIDRGFTGHEHLYGFGLINMNGRMYDPVMSSFLSPDNYIQAPDFSQSFNRYSYCMNNPLRYMDPDGESFVAAMLIAGAVIGAYTGGVLANNDYNPYHWEFGSGKTWGYMIGGCLTGLASSYAGLAVAGADFALCNTAAIATASLVNSGGTWLYTGGQTDLTVSLGAVSYNFTKGEIGYIGKKGNSILDNIGYGLGALYNFTDLYRLVTWDSYSYQEKCDLLKEATGHADDDCVSYIENLPNNDVACYNIEDNDIYMADPAFSKGRGWASSSLDHEWNHMERFDWQEYNLGNYNKNVDEFYANLTEVNNAAKNGLSYWQYRRQVNQVIKYANAARLDGFNLAVPDISGYSFKMYWSWLKRFYGF